MASPFTLSEIKRTPIELKFCLIMLGGPYLGNTLSGLWTFLAHAFLKLDRLAFCKGLKTVSLNLGEMNKEVFFVFRLNEAMTLTFVKPILLFLLP